MSLIIAVFTPTGIVLSGDSRTTGTLNSQVANPNDPSKQLNVQSLFTISDATHKIFKILGKYGIGTYGDAHVYGLPIAHHIEQFEIKQLQNQPKSINDLAIELLKFFKSFNPVPKTGFILAGYDENTPFVLGIDVFGDKISRINLNQDDKLFYGIVRGGEVDVINRLLNNPHRQPLFDSMNLQDGIDLSRHLIRATIDQMRFEPAVPTVGGEIDTLIITNNNTEFLYHKQLKC